ncbi:IS1380 family transposase [Pseudactinotalea sp. HY158]|uniref:IS1380 family transposase n=2 Tax=unclassified Pseudactinotalea TaxID=2649176 RepID=UPI00129C55D8|nr:IS1380 family transposase [Pseudactinotalea sp. HY158]QGH68676.1 IS1380 family transposase [Pseudactinotalea sp. HY158]
MQLSHVSSVRFDDPNLVGVAGLVPVMALAERAGLSALVAEHLSLSGAGSANPGAKVLALVAGMTAGADSIDDMDLLRHGGMGKLFQDARAPSTLGTFLRAFTFGHVRQLDAIASRFLTRLAGQAPVLAGAGQIAYVDIDDTIKETYGYAKQGAGYGYNKVKGLNALIATISTPVAAPLIVGTRLRRGPANSARGAGKFVADSLATARTAGAGGVVILRADSAYYSREVAAAAGRAGAHFSLTARMNPAITAAITSIDEQAWTPIRYPNAIWDEDEARLISDAQVAELPFTAFTSRPKAEHITARLIVRRVKRLNPAATRAGQDELFATYRYHAVFTDSPLSMLEAEKAHRAHAIIEGVHADLRASALAHAPSGKFTANAAWLVLAAIAFNLTRAAGALASLFHARATTATIREHLIRVPARLARSARRLIMHLPRNWAHQGPWEALYVAACGPPPAPRT